MLRRLRSYLTGKQARRAERSGAEAGRERGKMAAAAVAEFQRAQSLLGTDRNASIDILHSIGKYNPRQDAARKSAATHSDPEASCGVSIDTVSPLAAKLR